MPWTFAADGPTKFPAIHTLRHLLTPGTPAYALIKLVAVGGVFGLLAMRGRSTRARPDAESEADAKPARPHPTSKKKRSRKRRRR